MANYSVSEAFTPHFNSLARVAYFKVKSKKETDTKRILYETYRFVLWFFILLYNLQHLIRVIQVRESTEQMIDTLFILLTTLNCLGKQVAFNVRSHRVNKIIDIIDVVFYNKYIDKATFKLILFIFSFQLALAYMSILITIQAYGNVTMDCTIVAFYAQAKVQIQMLRYNLEHLVDIDDETIKIDARITKTNNERNADIHNTNDMINNIAQKRLAIYANHYKKITGFVKEIEFIFEEAMIFQFFSMAWVICMTVYKIVGLSSLLELISIVIYLGCMLAQFFVYCYYGTELKVESEFINQSVYCSDWRILSPGLRRQLLLLMTYCSKPVALRTAYVIPVSVDSYLAIGSSRVVRLEPICAMDSDIEASSICIVAVLFTVVTMAK
ncbi:uncharacterized protein ACR2FA_003022 [Aphomia sociella]